MTTNSPNICAICNATKDLDTELIVVTDSWGSLELRCLQCIDGEQVHNVTDWIGQD